MKSDKSETADISCLPVQAFRKPSTPVTSAWIEHTPFVFWLMQAIRPSVLVELGTLHGVSYFTFCEAVELFGIETKCFAVDTWEGDDHTGLYGEEVWKHVQASNRPYTSFSTLLRKTFDNALPCVEDGVVDLLHVDGRHFYDDVKHDFTSWIPKLSKSSIVIFHDINVHDKNFGVARYWIELKKQYPSFEFLHGNGLGVLAFGADIPLATRRLFDVIGSEAKAIKIAYSRLGSAVSNELELVHERSMVERLRSDVSIIQSDSAMLSREVERLRTENSRASELASAMDSERADYQARLEKFRSDIEELKSALQSSTSLVKSYKSQKSAQKSECGPQQKFGDVEKNFKTDSESIAGFRLQAMRAGLTETELRVQELESQKEKLTREKEKFELKVLNLEVSREQLRASRSWRFTAFFRKLSAIYKFARKSPNDIQGSGLLQRMRMIIRVRKTIRALASANIFDRDWYEENYPDVVGSGIDSLTHYVHYGAAEGRRPLEMFDTAWYAERYPDVVAAGINPLHHYMVSGALEGRDPCEAFDTDWYMSTNKDVDVSGINPLLHYEKFGRIEGRPTRPPELPSFKQEIEGPARMPGSANQFAFMPLISIVMPVYNVAAKWLRLAVKSVELQTYPNWELCICDDGSTNVDTLNELTRLEQKGGAVRVFRSPQNGGISAATNLALARSNGIFVAFLDNDDELTTAALETYVQELNVDQEIDVFYSDEAKIDENGIAEEPFYKPDWSPVMLREVMYVGHLLMARKVLVDEVGGPDSRFDGVQDFEFALRLTERARKIVHVRKILYYWRRIPGSVASHSEAKPDLTIKQSEAINMHLERLGIQASAIANPRHSHRLIVQPSLRNEWPKVSIVIPSKDAPQLISRCLDSIFEKTSYRNFEVIIVDNGTSDPAALDAMASHDIIKVELPGPFNFSRANNRGVDVAAGEYLILLNNDTEVIQSDWIEQMLFLLEDPSVVAVGPMLLYPDGTVQHAGVALGLRGTADHVLRGLPRDADGYFGSLVCTREVSAVTFACTMLRKVDYIAAHGLDELYQTHYQDVDMCLKLSEDGRTILYTPRSVLIHYESATRGPKYDAIDRMLFLDGWGHRIAKGDPYSRWDNEARQ
jgi:GT2 family glycosyltransferase